MQKNKLYNMNCEEGLKLVENNTVDLVVIDPPYLINLTKVKKPTKFNNYANDILDIKDGFNREILDLLVQKMKKINIYIYCSKLQVPMYLNYFKDKNCNYEILAWHKTNPSPLVNNTYLPDTEYVLFFRQKGVRVYGNYHTKAKYYLSGTLQKEKKMYRHPTVKPIEFIERHIINSSNEGDLVLDCFAGSGTTLVACIKNNRNFIGFEREEKYCKIAEKRINEALKQRGNSK